MDIRTARAAFEAGNFLEVADALSRNASDSADWFALSRRTVDRLLKQRHLAQAAALANRTVEMRPDDAGSHFLLGRCQARAAQLSAAVASFEKAIELKPERIASSMALAKVQAGLKQPDAAIATLIKAHERAPEDLDILRELVPLLVREQRYKQAARLIDKAMKLAPDDPVLRYNGALVLIRGERRLALARQWLEEEVERNANAAAPLLYLSALCADLDDEVAARRHYNACRRLAARHFIGGLRDENRPRVLIVQSVEAGHFSVVSRHIPVIRGGHAGVEFLSSLREAHKATIAIDGKRDHDLLARLVDHADLVVNALADPELLPLSLSSAEEVVEAPGAPPTINPPSRIWPTARDVNARRLAGIDGLVVPKVARLSTVGCDAAGAIEAIEEQGLRFPVAIRDAGTSTGQTFLRYESADDIRERLPKRGGTDRFVIEWHDLRQKGDFYRRFRVFFVDNVLYPKSLHVGWDWNVHSKDRLAVFKKVPKLRTVERDFVLDPAATLGDAAVAALHRINDRVGLDYFAIDFDLLDDGRLIFFEANAGVRNVPNPGIDPEIEEAVSGSNRALERLIVQRAKTAKQSAA